MTATSAPATAPYEDLAATVRGDVIRPGDPGYDEARAVYNGMIDKRPAAIARCRDVADVIACVRFAREHGAEIAVRGGGHNAAGLGVAPGTPNITIDRIYLPERAMHTQLFEGSPKEAAAKLVEKLKFEARVI